MRLLAACDCTAQTREGIECFLLVGTPFWERTEVKDLLAYLRLAATLSDEVALSRIINRPAREVGDKSVEKLQAWADATGQTLCSTLFGTPAVRLDLFRHCQPPLPHMLHVMGNGRRASYCTPTVSAFNMLPGVKSVE